MYSPNLLFFMPNLPRTSLDDDSVILVSGNIEFPSYDGFFWLGRFWLQITILTVKYLVHKPYIVKWVPKGITRKNPWVWVGLGLSLNSMGIFGLGTQRGL